MSQIEPFEARKQGVRPSEYLSDGVGAVVGCTEHHQASAARELRVPHGSPQVFIPADHVAGDEPAHRMGHEVHRLTIEAVLDEHGERVGCFVDILAPIVGKGLDVPLRAQSEHGPGVEPLVHSDGLNPHGGIGLPFAVARQHEIAQMAENEPGHIHPRAS